MKWTAYNTENIKGKYLFKFICQKYLLEFLRTGNLWFARSDRFGDKMECVMIKDLQKDVPDFQKIEARKRKHFISCFHVGTKETLAFWDTYAKNDEERRKYALRFNREEFIVNIEKNSLESVVPEKISKLVHGKVKYKNLIGAKTTVLQLKKVKFPAFRKEYVFAYEKEYRFVVSLKRESNKSGFNVNLGNPKEISFTIFVNPLLDSEDYSRCRETIAINNFEKNLKMSTLTKWLKPELW